jgi:hypothetical protein
VSDLTRAEQADLNMLHDVITRLTAADWSGDDISDWSGYPVACDPSTVLADLSDLARFLGGDDQSFTHQLLMLVRKARFSPENLNRLGVAFSRQVTAVLLWDTLCEGGPPTAERLLEILTLANRFGK